mmetsp:Transcript_21783/g.38503  ORF Transcript_21783/g.38503 Transcript_21783/m.38503 type:complete len:453 (-) Transcript_21783:70-1428(-)
MNWLPCKEDDDCRVAEVCVQAEISWNLRNVSYCHCNMYYGWTGPDCMSFSGRSTVVALCSVLMEFVCAFVVFVLSKDLYQLWKTNNKSFKVDSLLVTLVSTLITAVLTMIWRFLFLCQVLMPSLDSRIAGNGQAPMNLPMAVSSYVQSSQATMTFVSTVLTSVMWIEVSSSARNRSLQLVTNVRRYRRVVYISSSTFCMLVLVTQVLGYQDLSVILTTPLMLLCAVIFAVGRHRMVKLLKQVARSSEVSLDPNGKPFRQRDPVKDALVIINRTAMYAIFGLMYVILSGVLYLMLNQSPKGWAEYADPSTFSLVIFAGSSIVCGIIFLLVVVALYTHRQAQKVIRTRTFEQKEREKFASAPQMAKHVSSARRRRPRIIALNKSNVSRPSTAPPHQQQQEQYEHAPRPGPVQEPPATPGDVHPVMHSDSATTATTESSNSVLKSLDVETRIHMT